MRGQDCKERMRKAAGKADQGDVDHIDGVMPASQARSRDARDRLLRAGERVFAKMGYDNAHVSDIADAAGVSIGSFYRRFRDKETFFRALLHQFTGRYRDNTRRFFEMPQWENVPTEDVIATFVGNTALIMKRNEGFFRALMQRSLAGAGEEYWPQMRKAGEQQGKSLAAFLEKRSEASGGNLSHEATMALRVAEGMLLLRLVGVGAPMSESEMVVALAKLVKTQLGVTPSTKVKRKR
jgi:AcrR family transcriptional regulator